MKPRVSVLIPNYNNGKESSRSGDFDFTTILLKSLRRTLSSETTPFEILVYDDGSTDDSLATLRDWAKRKWTTGVMKGEPIITLIEAEHDGCLARTSNKLVQASQGEIWVRLDGDIEILTPNWVSELCAVFDNGPKDLGVVGPKQLKTDGRIHSMGDFVLDPRGYIHEGEGYPREAYSRTIEVDHVMGCFYCCKREVYEAVGGFDETFLRGQTVDFGMMARLQGYRCWATPAIEFYHHLTLRFSRSNKADSNSGVGSAVGTFRDKWGFCRLQPDLEAVQERYRGTPLLWNSRYFGPKAKPQRDRKAEVDKTEWGLFSKNETFQATIDRRITEIAKIWHSSSKAQPIVEVGCRAGLMLHLLATQGVPCLGYDEDPALIDLAIDIGERQEYPGPPADLRAPRGSRPPAARHRQRRDPGRHESAGTVLESDAAVGGSAAVPAAGRGGLPHRPAAGPGAVVVRRPGASLLRPSDRPATADARAPGAFQGDRSRCDQGDVLRLQPRPGSAVGHDGAPGEGGGSEGAPRVCRGWVRFPERGDFSPHESGETSVLLD